MDADFVIKNANIYTMDDSNPWAEALAYRGTKFVYVGDDPGVNDFIGPETRVVDAGGRSVLPGFIDSHFHLQFGASQLYAAQLYGLKTLKALKTALDQWVFENPGSKWVVGQGLSYSVPDNETPLTRHHLDTIFPNKPVALTAYDQHSVFANTAALQEAGILGGAGKALTNGEVVMGQDGLATGELYEMDAMNLIFDAMPQLDFPSIVELTKKALEMLASYGVTSIHNMDGDPEQAALYAFLADHDALTTRVYMPFWAKPEMSLDEVVRGAHAVNGYQGEFLRGGAVKFFMDGVYESYTAVTLDGYPDRPNHFGEPLWPAETFEKYVTAIDSLGYQIAVHACGEGAVRRVLDGYEAARRVNGTQDSRHRVEHIEMLSTADGGRFQALGVIASMQPLHSPHGPEDPDVWQSRVAPDQWPRAFPWRTLRDAGAIISFGSDWPVSDASPFLGLHAAVNRKPLLPGQISHAQTLEEAIRSFTRDAAFVEFQELQKGQIKVGMWADLVILDRNIFEIPVEELKDVRADLTVCNGRVVYESV